PRTQEAYIRGCKKLAAFLRRSPDGDSRGYPPLSAASRRAGGEHLHPQPYDDGRSLPVPSDAATARDCRPHRVHPRAPEDPARAQSCGSTAAARCRIIAFNTCRNRHCPKCQGSAAREWLAEREAELLPVPYFHVVYTLPAPIADIAYQNKAVIYDLLFKVSAEATLTIAADPKRLGARIGLTSMLHTRGSAMTHHPHVHMIVPGGGLSP